MLPPGSFGGRLIWQWVPVILRSSKKTACPRATELNYNVNSGQRLFLIFINAYIFREPVNFVNVGPLSCS